MAELVVNYTQNNFFQNISPGMDLFLKAIYILTDIYDFKLYNQTWTCYNLTTDFLKILYSTKFIHKDNSFKA